MRATLFLLSFLLASALQAAGLPGVYVLDAGNSKLIARLEVKGTTLTGVLEADGTAVISLTGAVNGMSAQGEATSAGGRGEFTARLSGDVLDLQLSEPAGPGHEASVLPLRLFRDGVQRPPRADAGGDGRLVGQWVSQEVTVSGNASMASETHLLVYADGRYALRSGSHVAGGEDWSYRGGDGGTTEKGWWQARAGVLSIEGPAGKWVRAGTYGLTEDGLTLRIIYDNGERTLWSRRQR